MLRVFRVWGLVSCFGDFSGFSSFLVFFVSPSVSSCLILKACLPLVGSVSLPSATCPDCFHLGLVFPASLLVCLFCFVTSRFTLTPLSCFIFISVGFLRLPETPWVLTPNCNTWQMKERLVFDLFCNLNIGEFSVGFYIATASIVNIYLQLF